MSGVENVRIRFSYSMIYGFGRMWIGKFSFRDRNQTIRKNKNEKFNFNNNRKENQPIKFDRVRRFGDFSWEGHTIRKKYGSWEINIAYLAITKTDFLFFGFLFC